MEVELVVLCHPCSDLMFVLEGKVLPLLCFSAPPRGRLVYGPPSEGR